MEKNQLYIPTLVTGYIIRITVRPEMLRTLHATNINDNTKQTITQMTVPNT